MLRQSFQLPFKRFWRFSRTTRTTPSRSSRPTSRSILQPQLVTKSRKNLNLSRFRHLRSFGSHLPSLSLRLLVYLSLLRLSLSYVHLSFCFSFYFPILNLTGCLCFLA